MTTATTTSPTTNPTPWEPWTGLWSATDRLPAPDTDADCGACGAEPGEDCRPWCTARDDYYASLED